MKLFPMLKQTRLAIHGISHNCFVCGKLFKDSFSFDTVDGKPVCPYFPDKACREKMDKLKAFL